MQAVRWGPSLAPWGGTVHALVARPPCARHAPPYNRPVPAILIVEPDPQMARLLETILSGADREVMLAGSAGEALAILEAQQITLIILDLTLPDTDGRNFLVLLRERSATAGVPVIILSGMGGPQPKAECFALGADAFFEKPLAPEVL